jgi:hypothetical protein
MRIRWTGNGTHGENRNEYNIFGRKKSVVKTNNISQIEKILCTAFYSHTPSICYSSSGWDTKLHTHTKQLIKLEFCNILNYKFLHRNGEDKRFGTELN